MSIVDPVPQTAGPGDSPRVSPGTRAMRVFVSPVKAWEGLEHQVQWWIPLLITALFSAGVFFLLYDRAVLPMMLEQMEEQVASGQLPAEQFDKIEAAYSGGGARYLMVGGQVLAVTLITFLVAAVVWFGIGFVLGAKFRYRLALEAVCWSNLVTLPVQLIVTAIAWSQETMKGVHIGLAALLPQSDEPSKLMVGLTVFLDAISPFSAWNLVVLVLAGSTLAAAPRRSVAWVLVSLYLALFAIGAVVSAIFSPGS